MHAVPTAATETEIACASVELAAPALPSTNSDINYALAAPALPSTNSDINYALGMASVKPSVDTSDSSVTDPDLIKVTFSDSTDVQVAGHDCHVCGKSFPSNAAVLAHLRKHSDERKFPCTECEMKFKDGTTLRQHMRRHTGERPYKCSRCDKAFKQQSQLNQHVRLHTGERPYTCSFCQRTFVQRNHVDRHVRTHTGEKPYACSLCAATFVDRSSLNLHARKHGLGPIRPKAGLAGGRMEPRNGGRPPGSFRPHKGAVVKATADGAAADGDGVAAADAAPVRCRSVVSVVVLQRCTTGTSK